MGFGVVLTYILILYFQTVVGIWRYIINQLNSTDLWALLVSQS